MVRLVGLLQAMGRGWDGYERRSYPIQGGVGVGVGGSVEVRRECWDESETVAGEVRQCTAGWLAQAREKVVLNQGWCYC